MTRNDEMVSGQQSFPQEDGETDSVRKMLSASHKPDQVSVKGRRTRRQTNGTTISKGWWDKVACIALKVETQRGSNSKIRNTSQSLCVLNRYKRDHMESSTRLRVES